MKARGNIRFVLGFIIGSLIFGSVTYAAGSIAATRASSRILVDGQEAAVEAYLIEGRTYLQLRDMANLLEFDVEWDADSNTVLVNTGRDSDAHTTVMQTTPALQATQEHDAVTPPITKGLGEVIKPVNDATQLTVTESKPKQKGGYDTVFTPLKTGDIIKVEPVATSIGSVGGEYEILRGIEDRPWKTADGKDWPRLPLPEWRDEWDDYPSVEIPYYPPVRFTGETQGHPYDTLMIVNPYEIERMIRTIYIYAKDNPALWMNRDPAGNIPNFSIKVEIANDMGYNTFYPWRDVEMEKQTKFTGSEKVFRIYAYDTYNNGKFVDTEYFVK